jgi:ferredoxin-nitrite reductase
MNKIEEYKQEKDGLDILQDVPRYASAGWEKIPDDDKERLKWAGVFFAVRRPAVS